MVSNVEITDFALNQLDEYVGYIIEKFKNDQAAKSVLEDARFESLYPCSKTSVDCRGFFLGFLTSNKLNNSIFVGIISTLGINDIKNYL